MRSISTLVLMLMGFSLGVPSHAHKGFFMSDKSPDELEASWKKHHPNEIGDPYHFWTPTEFYIWVDDQDNVYYDCKGRGRPSEVITCTEPYVKFTHWGNKRIKTKRISEDILQIGDNDFACKVNWRKLPKTPSDCTKDGYKEQIGFQEFLKQRNKKSIRQLDHDPSTLNREGYQSP